MTNLGALNFGGALAQPYAGLTPVYWAPLNSSGVGTPSTGSLNGVQTYGAGITPGLLAEAQYNLGGIFATGLATVAETGANSQALVGGLFTNWGSVTANIAQENANTFQQAVQNSANANVGQAGGIFAGILKGIGGLASFF